jgi:predicted aldo/keto reductase-like oxidoreductase
MNGRNPGEEKSADTEASKKTKAAKEKISVNIKVKQSVKQMLDKQAAKYNMSNSDYIALLIYANAKDWEKSQLDDYLKTLVDRPF